MKTDLFEELNENSKERRLSAVQEVASIIKRGDLQAEASEEVNNHVHTIYSFSPYSPAMAAYKAREAGLKAVGIMDHDSISGGDEFLEACKAFGIGSTAGFELRTNFTGTRIEGRRINSPDSVNIGYIVIHGIPKKHFKKAEAFLEPLQQRRNKRNRAMIDRLNDVLKPAGMDPIDFAEDVFPLSQAAVGGTITERHILYAFGEKCISAAGRGEKLLNFLKNKFNCSAEGRLREYLSDEDNPHYLYDLLGLFKIAFLPQIFIQPDEQECIPVQEVVDFGNSIGAIPGYAYLGDVGDSPTGDKKAQKFEDDYLTDVLDTVKEIGFKAVTYMPPRNTREQLARIRKMCSDYDLMEISGVDINSSRQSFNCPIILEPAFRHLIDATWALIAHEKLSDRDERLGLFHPENPYASSPLTDRIAAFSRIGRDIDPHFPEKALDLIQR